VSVIKILSGFLLAIGLAGLAFAGLIWLGMNPIDLVTDDLFWAIPGVEPTHLAVAVAFTTAGAVGMGYVAWAGKRRRRDGAA
jgi:hypothetical protein